MQNKDLFHTDPTSNDPDFNRGEYQIAFKATPGATLRETGEAEMRRLFPPSQSRRAR